MDKASRAHGPLNTFTLMGNWLTDYDDYHRRMGWKPIQKWIRRQHFNETEEEDGEEEGE